MKREEAIEKAHRALADIIARLRAIGVMVDEAKRYEDEDASPRVGVQLAANGLFLRWGIVVGPTSGLACAELMLAMYSAGEETDDDPREFTECVSVSYEPGATSREHHWIYSDIVAHLVPEAVTRLLGKRDSRLTAGDTDEYATGLSMAEDLGRRFLVNAERRS